VQGMGQGAAAAMAGRHGGQVGLDRLHGIAL
jgi:hypothetical protein